MVSFWTILTSIAPILAPIVSLVLVLIGRVIWNHETRLRSLEQSKTRHGRTLYGDEDDFQQEGLSKKIRELTERLDSIEQKLDRLEEKYDE